jgi:AcrR family transcriptional regulator
MQRESESWRQPLAGGFSRPGFAGTDAPMTSLSYGPPVRGPAAMSSPTPRGRRKLAPDPDVRSAILAAASKSVHDQGVHGLSIAAVLERAQLGTRAFYRHFESKDQLVAEVFLEMARVETLRLRTKMANTTSPVEAVAAWIDGRLDRAFDENTNVKLRRLSQEARSEAFSSPEMVSPAYRAMLEPLIEQLQRGLVSCAGNSLSNCRLGVWRNGAGR